MCDEPKKRFDAGNNRGTSLKTIQQAFTKEDKNVEDADDHFGKMVATEMKMMSAHLKFRFKHDVNNLIFNYQTFSKSDVNIHQSNVINQPAASVTQVQPNGQRYNEFSSFINSDE